MWFPLHKHAKSFPTFFFLTKVKVSQLYCQTYGIAGRGELGVSSPDWFLAVRQASLCSGEFCCANRVWEMRKALLAALYSLVKFIL